MKVLKKHPLAIRWFHWINFPILAIMIWSGMLIYWANDEYRIEVGGKMIIAFFPEWFYEALNISARLAEGMAFHFVFMWIFFINGLLYILYTLISGEWKFLLPDRQAFKDSWIIVLHSLKIKKGILPSTNKYNAAQRVAYSAIIFMGIGSV